MKAIYHPGKQLGRGSYGTVREYTTGNSHYAVKSFPAREANLLEISLMASYRHPYLIHAEYIDYYDDTVNLFMPMAVSDLAHQIKKNHSLAVRTTWCYQIAKGIESLHRNDFIHADLKSNNILYMDDHSVKITDYTLTVKQWHREQTFGGSACTINYRAPEIFLGEWGREIDIWALGCVFYEIMFGTPLFHHHKDYQDHDRTILWQRMYNQLLEWRYLNSNEPREEEYHPVTYHPLVIAPEYYQSSYQKFRHLLEGMLTWNRSHRLTITEVVSHPWFGWDQPSMIYLCREALPFTGDGGTGNLDRQNRLITLGYGLTDDNIVRQLALHYLQRLAHYHELSESIIAEVCITIAYKIVHRTNPSLPLISRPPEVSPSYYHYEAKIATALGFVLH